MAGWFADFFYLLGQLTCYCRWHSVRFFISFHLGDLVNDGDGGWWWWWWWCWMWWVWIGKLSFPLTLNGVVECQLCALILHIHENFSAQNWFLFRTFILCTVCMCVYACMCMVDTTSNIPQLAVILFSIDIFSVCVALSF